VAAAASILSAAAELPPPANLMAYYPLEGVVNISQTPNLVPGWGDAALPSSGGALSGISIQPGVVGNGLRLTANTSYIQSGTMDPFTYAGTDAFSVMYWIWTPSSLPLGFAVMVSKQSQSASPTTYFRTVLRSNPDIQIFGTSGTQQTGLISPSPAGRWMHVAITGVKSGTTATWQLFLDGQAVSLSGSTTTLDPAAVARPLRFGATLGGSQAAPNTMVDEYYFYNTVLTEAQINGYLNSLILPTGLSWYGSVNPNWDLSSLNWESGTASYQEPGGVGNAVTFNDYLYNDGINPLHTNIILTTSLQPASVRVDNFFYPFRFSGPGKLTGAAVLCKTNAGSLYITATNDHTGGTVLQAGDLLLGNDLALGAGPVRLEGGILTSDGTTPRTLTNAVSFLNNVSTTVTLGADGATGALTLGGPVDFRSGGRAARFNTAAAFTGGSSNGYLSAKSGAGTLRLSGAHNWRGACAIREGQLSLTDATFTNAGALALNCNVAGGLAKVTVDAGSSLTLTGSGSYLRLGVNGDTTATNQCDIAGQVRLIGDGRILMSGGGTLAVANLLPGAEAAVSVIQKEGPTGFAQFNFNGGTLRAQANSTSFIQNLDQANVLSGGLTIDTAGYEVTITQPLLNGGGGGLSKAGLGTLTLNGTNSYTGATAVNAGELRFGSAYRGASVVTVADGAKLGCWSDAPGAGARISTATIGSATGAGLHVWFTGQSGNPSAPAGHITNLTLIGTISVQVDAVNLAASAVPIPLVRYVTLSGSGAVTGDLPRGIGGYVTNNTATKTIELVVTSISPLIWTGVGTNSWDVGVSMNWQIGGNPTPYLNGDMARFDDSAVNSAVAIASQVSPNGIVISNTALAYFLTNLGAGKISGDAPVAITKEGTHIVTLGGTNDFNGEVIVKNGILALDNASALGTTLGSTSISNGATLNLKSIALGGRVETIYVLGAGQAGMGALYSDRPALTDTDSFRDVRLLGDTTVGAPSGSRFGFTDPSATLSCIGGLYKFTKVGGGWFQFEDAFINVGEIEVKDGVLQTWAGTRIATNGNALILNNGTLRMGQVVAPIDRPMLLTNGVVHVVANVQASNNRLAGTITLGGSGTFLVEPNCVGTVVGEITGPGDLIKTGAGYLALLAANTYTGNTIVSNGVLELFDHTTGSVLGSIAHSANIHLGPEGALDVYYVLPAWTLESHQSLTGDGGINGNVIANGTVAPGAGSAMGSLAVSFNLDLAGTNILKVTKEGGLANDSLSVGAYLTYGGVLKVVLVGSTPLAVNDTFALFNCPNAAPFGNFSEIQMPPGYEWDLTNLGVNGTVRVAAVTAPPTLDVTRTGDNLLFSWQGTYKLQAQTNGLNVGLSSNWHDYPGGGTSGVLVPIDFAKGTVFFRLSTP
jgi:autotransporter-associated beta strand protein